MENLLANRSTVPVSVALNATTPATSTSETPTFHLHIYPSVSVGKDSESWTFRISSPSLSPSSGLKGSTLSITFQNDRPGLQSTSQDYGWRWYLEDHIEKDVFSTERANKIGNQLVDYLVRLMLALWQSQVVRELRCEAERVSAQNEKVNLVLVVGEVESVTFDASVDEAKQVHRPNVIWEMIDGCRDDPHFWWMVMRTAPMAVPTSVSPRPPIFPFKSFHILLVASRSLLDSSDHDHRIVSKPLFEIISSFVESSRLSSVSIELVRPGTFTALKEHLKRAKQNGKSFDCLHFDCHGSIISQRIKGTTAKKRLAVLHFLNPQDPLGKPQYVTGSAIASLLLEYNVKMVIMNACNSASDTGTSGPETNTNLAKTLVGAGIPIVVACSFRLLARAGSIFMREFYGRIILRGKSVAEAVSDARREVQDHPEREGRFGQIRKMGPDMAVFTLYMRDSLVVEETNARLDVPRKIPLDPIQIPEDPALSKYFHIREPKILERPFEIMQIETVMLLGAAREGGKRAPVVQILGVSGTGKTLVLRDDAALWWERTGFVRKAVYFDCLEVAKNSYSSLDSENKVDQALSEVLLQIQKRFQQLIGALDDAGEGNQKKITEQSFFHTLQHYISLLTSPENIPQYTIYPCLIILDHLSIFPNPLLNKIIATFLALDGLPIPLIFVTNVKLDLPEHLGDRITPYQLPALPATRALSYTARAFADQFMESQAGTSFEISSDVSHLQRVVVLLGYNPLALQIVVGSMGKVINGPWAEEDGTVGTGTVTQELISNSLLGGEIILPLDILPPARNIHWTLREAYKLYETAGEDLQMLMLLLAPFGRKLPHNCRLSVIWGIAMSISFHDVPAKGEISKRIQEAGFDAPEEKYDQVVKELKHIGFAPLPSWLQKLETMYSDILGKWEALGLVTTIDDGDDGDDDDDDDDGYGEVNKVGNVTEREGNDQIDPFLTDLVHTIQPGYTIHPLLTALLRLLLQRDIKHPNSCLRFYRAFSGYYAFTECMLDHHSNLSGLPLTTRSYVGKDWINFLAAVFQPLHFSDPVKQPWFAFNNFDNVPLKVLNKLCEVYELGDEPAEMHDFFSWLFHKIAMGHEVLHNSVLTAGFLLAKYPKLEETANRAAFMVTISIVRYLIAKESMDIVPASLTTTSLLRTRLGNAMAIWLGMPQNSLDWYQAAYQLRLFQGPLELLEGKVDEAVKTLRDNGPEFDNFLQSPETETMSKERAWVAARKAWNTGYLIRAVQVKGVEEQEESSLRRQVEKEWEYAITLADKHSPHLGLGYRLEASRCYTELELLMPTRLSFPGSSSSRSPSIQSRSSIQFSSASLSNRINSAFLKKDMQSLTRLLLCRIEHTNQGTLSAQSSQRIRDAAQLSLVEDHFTLFAVYLQKGWKTDAMHCLNEAINLYSRWAGFEYKGSLRIVNFHDHLAWMYMIKAFVLVEVMTDNVDGAVDTAKASAKAAWMELRKVEALCKAKSLDTFDNIEYLRMMLPVDDENPKTGHVDPKQLIPPPTYLLCLFQIESLYLRLKILPLWDHLSDLERLKRPNAWELAIDLLTLLHTPEILDRRRFIGPKGIQDPYPVPGITPSPPSAKGKEYIQNHPLQLGLFAHSSVLSFEEALFAQFLFPKSIAEVLDKYVLCSPDYIAEGRAKEGKGVYGDQSQFQAAGQYLASRIGLTEGCCPDEEHNRIIYSAGIKFLREVKALRELIELSSPDPENEVEAFLLEAVCVIWGGMWEGGMLPWEIKESHTEGNISEGDIERRSKGVSLDWKNLVTQFRPQQWKEQRPEAIDEGLGENQEIVAQASETPEFPATSLPPVNATSDELRHGTDIRSNVSLTCFPPGYSEFGLKRFILNSMNCNSSDSNKPLQLNGVSLLDSDFFRLNPIFTRVREYAEEKKGKGNLLVDDLEEWVMKEKGLALRTQQARVGDGVSGAGGVQGWGSYSVHLWEPSEGEVNSDPVRGSMPVVGRAEHENEVFKPEGVERAIYKAQVDSERSEATKWMRSIMAGNSDEKEKGQEKKKWWRPEFINKLRRNKG